MARSSDPLAGLERELAEIAALQQQAAQAGRQEALPDLLDWVAQLSPTFEGKPAKPMPHLAPLVRLFERAMAGEQVRAVVNVPPRHGKTELCLHGIAWCLAHNPALRVGYLSATAAMARKKSLRAKKLTAQAGIKLARDSASKSDWRTTSHEGGCWAAGVDGQINGEGFDLAFCDDPHKGRSEAESQVLRDKTYDWFKADVLNRMSPDGSIFVVHTRWHPDDLAGRLIAEGWEHVILPGINERGEALWPELWPLDRMLQKQRDHGGPNGYEWRALFMGDPLPSGTTIFQGAHFYEAVPPLGLARIWIGIDFAYSTRTRADHSVAVVMAEIEGRYYVLNVCRVQKEPRGFLADVKALLTAYPSASVSAYAAATEMGGVEFFREAGIPITGHRATSSKLDRALPTAAAWNAGDILLPAPGLAGGTWSDTFLSEIKNFTGEPGGKDDQVDALAAAYDSLRVHSLDWDYLDRLKGAWPQALSF